MKQGTDNSGTAGTASASEYWREHQLKRHHKTTVKPEDKKKLKA
jgi:hypothetical protein